MRTSGGKGRAWIRCALMEQTLESYISALARNETLVEEWYESWAMMRQEDEIHMLIAAMAPLSMIQFNLCLKDVDFDNLPLPKESLESAMARQRGIDARAAEAKEKESKFMEMEQKIAAQENAMEQVQQESERTLAAQRSTLDHIGSVKDELAQRDSIDRELIQSLREEIKEANAKLLLQSSMTSDQTMQTLKAQQVKEKEHLHSIEALREEMRDLQSQLALARTQEEKEQSTREVIQREKESLEETLSLLKEKMQFLIDEQQTDKAALAELCAEKERQIEAETSSSRVMESLEGRIRALQEGEEANKQSIASLQDSLGQKVEELTLSQSTQEEAISNATRIQQILDERTQEYCQLQVQLEESAAISEKLRNTLNSKEEELSAIQVSLKDLQEEAHRLSCAKSAAEELLSLQAAEVIGSPEGEREIGQTEGQEPEKASKQEEGSEPGSTRTEEELKEEVTIVYTGGVAHGTGPTLKRAGN